MELTELKNYSDFKNAMDGEIRNHAEGFVRIGYLLKVARDTEILYTSGYASVAEFAQAEYGLTKDMVSRYIAINDKYSEGGYSDRLTEQYTGYGIAKLQEMLTLPDAVSDLLTPDMTKREIVDVRNEIREEEKITDIEVMLEEKKGERRSLIENFLDAYFLQNREQFVALTPVIEGSQTGGAAVAAVMDVLAPSGSAARFVRVPGTGKVMAAIAGADKPWKLLSVRTDKREDVSWDCVIHTMQELYVKAGKSGWEAFYGEPYEKTRENTQNPEQEPVQTENPENLEPKTPENVENPEREGHFTTETQNSEVKTPENVENPECEGHFEGAEKPCENEPEIQLPGQDNVMNHTEWIPQAAENALNQDLTTPENVKNPEWEGHFDTEKQDLEPKTPENVENPECEGHFDGESRRQEIGCRSRVSELLKELGRRWSTDPDGTELERMFFDASELVKAIQKIIDMEEER